LWLSISTGYLRADILRTFYNNYLMDACTSDDSRTQESIVNNNL
jgi:hypothetical protein